MEAPIAANTAAINERFEASVEEFDIAYSFMNCLMKARINSVPWYRVKRVDGFIPAWVYFDFQAG